MRPVTSIK